MLLLRLSYGSGRDILHGLTSHLRRERLRWRLHVVNFEVGRAADAVEHLVVSGAAGIIAHGLNQPVVDAIAGYSGPVVLIGAPETEGRLVGRAGPVAYVHADEAAVARAGAAHLRSLGRMRSYGFVGYIAESTRAGTFRRALEGCGAEVRTFFSTPIGGVAADGKSAGQALELWLKDLPKPAAVMAENDNYATWVLERAAAVRVKIPKDLALLGVDNDELLCETSDPPISSVAIDHEKLGELAAEALRRLLSGRRRAKAADLTGVPFTLLAPVRGVVERQSARPVAPAAALAERAASFIRHNATKGITAADVVAHLRVSRTLANLRYRQIYGESILGAILRVRLDAAKRKLAETSLSIGQVAAACGFGSESRAKHLFKERFGVSMREWRAAARQAKWS